MRWSDVAIIVFVVFGTLSLLWVILVGIPKPACGASAVCASSTCLTNGECGQCRCARAGPGPDGVCVVR